MRYAASRGKGVVVELPFNPHKGKCEACGKIVGRDIKFTAFHHWYYKYQGKTVKENPMLILENTNELCYGCHSMGDAIRTLLYANPQRVAQVAMLLTGNPRKRFIMVLDEISKKLKEQNIELAKRILEMGKNG